MAQTSVDSSIVGENVQVVIASQDPIDRSVFKDGSTVGHENSFQALPPIVLSPTFLMLL